MRQLSNHDRLVSERAAAISSNRSRRLRGLPPLPVPPKPERRKVPVAYTADGDYHGRLASEDECPDGCVIHWEDDRWQ